MSATAAVALWFGLLTMEVVMIIDSCRKPIPRLKLRLWAGYCVLVLILAVAQRSLVRQWFYQPFAIPTAGMQPTLMGNRKSPEGQTLKGDQILVDKWRYHFHSPARGDIAVFKTDGIAESERARYAIPVREFYIKRVVGLPGERISIHSANIYINGQKLSDPRVVEHISVNTNVDQDLLRATLPDKEVQLGPDEYFVVGDNIVNSLDSRYYGPIKRKYFLGRVTLIYWPFARLRAVE